MGGLIFSHQEERGLTEIKRYIGDCDNINHPEVSDVNLYKGEVKSSFLDKRNKLSDLGKIDLIKQKKGVDRANDFATERILRSKHDNAVNRGEKMSRASMSMVVSCAPWKK